MVFFKGVFVTPKYWTPKGDYYRITSFVLDCEYELISGEDYGFTMFWWLALIFFGYGSSQHIGTHSKLAWGKDHSNFIPCFVWLYSRQVSSAQTAQGNSESMLFSVVWVANYSMICSAWCRVFWQKRRKVSTSYDTLGRIKRRSELGGSKIRHTAIRGS